MNPFKKHKEAREAKTREFNNGLLQIEQKFDAAIQEANQLTDPAVKIIALNRVSDAIYAQIESEAGERSQKAKSAEKKTHFAGNSVAIAAAVPVAALVTVAGGWVFMAPLAVGLIGSDIVSVKRKEAVRKKLQLAASGHTKNMLGQIDLISEMIEGVVKNNVEAISKSPLKRRVLALSGLDEKFAEAAAKHMTTLKAPQADAATKKLRIIRPGNHL